MNLRDFLYLDRELVRTFLAQIEGGLVDETTERQAHTGTGGFGASGGVGPLSLSVEKGKERSVESEAIVRQSAASEFDRLYRLLEADDLVILDSVDDADVLSQLSRKQIIEVDARAQVGGMHKLLQLIGTFGSMVPLMGQVGADISLDDEVVAGMQAVSALTDQSNSLPVIVTVNGEADVKAALELKSEFVTTDTWDLEVSVLMKVQRVLKPAETYTVGDPFGGFMKMLPEEERSKLVESLDVTEMAQFGLGDLQISSPGFIGVPIAIYR